MATDLSDVVKQGYLRCKTRCSMFGGVWQKRWIVLRRTSAKGPCRLEKFPNELAARNVDQHKVQLLTNVHSIERLPDGKRRHAFSIDFNDGSSKFFACDSDLEADNWVKLTMQECLIHHASIGGNGIDNGEPDVLKPGIQKELQEQFKVYLMPSSKLEAFGECLLQVTHENIYLWDHQPGSSQKVKLAAWPLTALRRYGSDLTKFTFEAGRHCATGEGMFMFHTLEGEKIYRKVHQATLAIAEAHQRMKKQLQQQQERFDDDNDDLASPKSSFPDRYPTQGNHYVVDHHHHHQSNTETNWYHSDDDGSVSMEQQHHRSQVYNQTLTLEV